MTDWKREYDIKTKLDSELKEIVADEGRFADIMERVKEEQYDGGSVRRQGKAPKSVKTMFRAAFIAAAIMICSAVTVFAVIKSRYRQEPVGKYTNHFEQSESNPMIIDVDQSKTSEQLNSADDKIIVTWGEYITNGHELYVNVTLKSKDGSPIMVEENNLVPNKMSLSPEKVYVTVDGKKSCFIKGAKFGEDDRTIVAGGYGGNVITGIGCMWYATSVADDLSSATIEIQYSNYDVELYGRDIKFELENMDMYYCNFEDVCGQTTVAGLLEGKEAGKDKVHFSDVYPDCYIEDFGFVKDEAYGKQAFYMTFAGENINEAMEKMCLQSTITGLTTMEEKITLPDGRIQMLYVVTRDKAYDEIVDGGMEPMDTEWSHLEKVILKKELEPDKVRLLDGSSGVTFKVEAEDQSVDADVDIPVKALDSEEVFVIKNIEIDGMFLMMNGTTSEDFAFEYFGTQRKEYRPVCTMKDGTVQLMEFYSGGGNTNTGVASFGYAFTTPVNVDDIEKIVWHDVVIWQAQ